MSEDTAPQTVETPSPRERRARARARQPKQRRGSVKIIGFIVVIAVVAGLKLFHKSHDDEDVKKAVMELIAGLPDYDQEKAYYDALFEGAHPVAFEASYSMGTRHRSASIDADRYWSVLLGAMIAKAQEDGRTEIASNLIEAKARLEEPDPGEEDR